jgi:hypothetical protein
MRSRYLGLLIVALGACGKGGDGGGGSAGAGGARAAVIEAWKHGGLTPSALTAATTPVGKDCQSGTVGAVDVLADAAAGQPAGAGLGFLGFLGFFAASSASWLTSRWWFSRLENQISRRVSAGCDDSVPYPPGLATVPSLTS